jgi:integrase
MKGTRQVPRTATRGHYVTHPSPRYRDRIRLVQGRRQEYPDRWEAQYKDRSGKWCQPVSLKTSDEEDAKTLAVEILIQRDAGVQLKSRRNTNTLKDISVETIARLERERDEIVVRTHPDKGRAYDLKIRIIKKVLLPQFGDQSVTEITEPVISTWLKGYRVNGAKQGSSAPVKPARSTVGNINGAYQEMMRDAYDRGWISRDQIQRIDQARFAKGERRPTFSVPEIQRLAKHMSDKWVEAGHTNVVREDRYMLRALVALLAVTGLRPGIETTGVTFGQVEDDVRDSRGHLSVRIHIRANQGKRDRSRTVWLLKSDRGWKQAGEKTFRDYLEWFAVNWTENAERENPKRQIFRRPSDGELPNFPVTFRALLDEIGLRRDPITGMDRPLYSLRHYYATEAILRGQTTAQLVGQMGTTIQMLDQHYAHVIHAVQSADATGSGAVDKARWEAMRQRKQSNPSESERYPDGSEIQDSEEDGLDYDRREGGAGTEVKQRLGN